MYSLTYRILTDGFPEEALQPAGRLLDIWPDRVDAAAMLAVVFLKLNRFDEAEQVLTAALSSDPENGVLLCNLAKVYDKQGRTELSRQTLVHAMDVDPNQENGFIWYIALEWGKGGEAAVRQALNRLAALPQSRRASSLQKSALDENDLAEAERHYRLAFAATDVLPGDALMKISGDLGIAGALRLAIDIVAPRYDIARHGLPFGNNFSGSMSI